MQADFSWYGPARKYLRMYAEIAPAGVRALFEKTLLPRPTASGAPTTEYKQA
jgi:hypothetical protein